MNDKKFTITLTEAELNVVFTKLADAPFKDVAPVIGSIQQQLQQSQQPAPQ